MINVALTRTGMLAALSLTFAQAGTVAVAGVAGSGGPPPAAPSVYAKATPTLILQLVRGAGYSASLDSGGDDPVISISRKNDQPDVDLVLLKCSASACEKVFIYTDYDASELDAQPDESDMAAWNLENYTQAYIDTDDDDSPTLSDLYYFVGGFTKANFSRWLKEFNTDADDFGEMLSELEDD